ncbi:MAG: hypothetical protein QNK24_08025 [Desulfuromusa sp.]|nr:hypothetical protein [Desulfuromusa sp.]
MESPKINFKPISWGDLIKAMHDLPLQTEEQKKMVLKFLGFDDQTDLLESVKSRSAPDVTSDWESSKRTQTARKEQKISAPPPRSNPLSLPDQSVPGNLKKKGKVSTSSTKPDWDYQFYDAKIYDPAEQITLIPQTTIRGVLTGMLRVLRETRQIDIKTLIKQSVSGLPPRHLPYQLSGTVTHGCQLFLDHSESMSPWANDLQALQHQLTNVIGADLVMRYRFDESPMEAESITPGSRGDAWKPRAQTPVLVVSDFGQPTSASRYLVELHWSKFIDECRKVQCPLVCLVPWWIDPVIRETLGNYPYLFHWLPSTTANEVRSVIGAGHRL